MRKRGIVSEYLPWLLIALALLVIMMIVIFLLKGKIFLLGDKVKDLFSGGRFGGGGASR